MSGPLIVVVDPYSSGAMLVKSLRDRGGRCVAVESNPDLPLDMRTYFEPRDFDEVISHQGDLAATIEAVARHRPHHVIAGFESGVELSERLAHALGLMANGARPSPERWQKFAMIKRVADAGLTTARQAIVTDPADAAREAVALEKWPIIVKPARSVASDHVVRCTTVDEVLAAARRAFETPNILGTMNTEVVVQEYLAGTEFIVDVVSYQRHRKVTAIWQYGRRSSADELGYDRMELLPYTGERQQALVQYAFACLDVLDIHFGPAHCELMWVDGEPVLIEIGARLSAGINAILSRLCGGVCQLDETCTVLLEPNQFLASLDVQPQLTKCGMNLFLLPQTPGRLVRTHGLDEIERLPTVHSISAARTPGQLLGRVAGRVTLISDDRQQLQADVARIEELETRGIFEVVSE